MSTEEEKRAFKEKIKGIRFGGTGMYVPHGKTTDDGRMKESKPSS